MNLEMEQQKVLVQLKVFGIFRDIFPYEQVTIYISVESVYRSDVFYLQVRDRLLEKIHEDKSIQVLDSTFLSLFNDSVLADTQGIIREFEREADWDIRRKYWIENLNRLNFSIDIAILPPVCGG